MLSLVSWVRASLIPLSLFFWDFLALPILVFVGGKCKENHQKKKQGLFSPTEPPKSLEKKGKMLKKNKEFLARNRKRNSNKKTKEGQGISLLFAFCDFPCFLGVFFLYFQRVFWKRLRNAVSRALLRKRELYELCGKRGEICEEVSEFALAHR